MRIVFLLILIAGLVLGIGYPFAVQNISGYEIGRYQAYDRQGGFRVVEENLSPADAPVRVLVDMTSIGSLTLSGVQTALTLTASLDGRTVLASTLTFAHQEPRPDSPQASGAIYRDEAGMIDPVEGGRYRFVIGPGDAEGIDMRSVELVLRAGAFDLDPRAVPVGYMLMAIGFIGFVLALRRGRSPKTPPAPPPPPKWGRDGA
jgi:hypothetical protein